MRTWNKVFEIGDPKTGTTSLGKAFELLGLRHTSWNPRLHEKVHREEFDELIQIAEDFEAFEDSPWHETGFYKILDKAFPNSKFILVERDIESWIKSHENHFSSERNLNNISKDLLIENYRDKRQDIIDRHIQKYEEIKTYFKDRPKDLLIMNICGGEGWEKLCPFLELPLPGIPFPHELKTRPNSEDIEELNRHISYLEQKNKNEVKNLSKKINHLENELNLLKNSISYKIARIMTKPYRILFRR